MGWAHSYCAACWRLAQDVHCNQPVECWAHVAQLVCAPAGKAEDEVERKALLDSVVAAVVREQTCI
jgi:hypothetical protein